MPCHQSSSTSARVFARGNALRVTATASRRRAHWTKAKATRTDPGVYACPPADGEAGSVPPGQRGAFGQAKVTTNRSPMTPPAAPCQRRPSPGDRPRSRGRLPPGGQSARGSPSRPAHPDTKAVAVPRHPDVVRQAGDHGEAELRGQHGRILPVAARGGLRRPRHAIVTDGGSVGHHHLEPLSGTGQRNPDRLTRAVLLVHLDRP